MGNPRIAVVVGLAVFGVVFAMNSSIHSSMILSYTDAESVNRNVGFYDMANAAGRLVGTLLSGALFPPAAAPELLIPLPSLQIRPFEPGDWPAPWCLLEPVFRAGETFPHDPVIREDEARASWVEQSCPVRVALDAGGAVLGTYDLRPNSLSLGAHVANAGYVDALVMFQSLV